MSGIKAVLKKELKVFFNSPIAYIALVIFLLTNNLLYSKQLFLNNQVSMRAFFSFLPWVFLFFVPAVTMRVWSDEKRTGTIETLLTLPVSTTQVVLGKFLSILFFIAVALGLTFSIPIILALLGDPEGGVILTSYLGAGLFATTLASIGFWVSGLTKNQVTAFLVAAGLSFALYVIGFDFIIISSPKFLGGFFKFISISTHYQSISRGVIDSRDLLYFGSVTAFFLFLNIKSLNTKR